MPTTGDGVAPPDPASDLQLLIHSAPSLIHTGRPDGHLDFFNQTWLTYVGRPLEDLEGWKWTAFIYPEDLEGIVESWRASLASGEPFLYEARVLRADGEYRWMLHHKIAVRNGRGQIVKWHGSSIDIEDRKRAEEQLRRREAYLAEAQRLSHTGSFGWNVLTDEHFWSDETFRIFEFATPSKISLPMILERVHPHDRPSVTMASAAAANGEGIDFECRLLLPDERIKYLHIVGRAERSGAGGIEVIGAVMDVTSRKLTEIELQRSKAHLSDAQTLSRTGSVGMEISTKRIFWSEESARIYGYPPGTEPTPELILQRVHPGDVDLLKSVLGRAAEGGGNFDFEHRLLMPDGSIKHIYNLSHCHRDEAGNEEIVGAIMDITERRVAEETIRRSEAEFRQILDLAPQLVSVYGPDRQRVYANRVMLDYQGLNLEQWRQRSDFGASIHPDDRERGVSCFDQAVSSEAAFEFELRLKKHDGSHRWFLARGNPMCDDRGQVTRWYIACADIDDRKQAEGKIRESEAGLLEAQRISHTGSWKQDLASGTVTITPEVARIFGIQPEEIASTAEFFFGRIHPEDRPGEASDYQRAVLNKTDFETDYRIVLPDGSVRHVHNIGHPKLNAAGDLVQFVGTVIDVTAAKEAEKKILQSERDARQLVDLSPLHITLLGPDGSRIYNNYAALDYCGLTLEAWQGADTQGLTHPQNAELGGTEITGKFLHGVPFDVEMQLRRRDGQYRWFQYRFSPMVDEQGRITRWCGAGTDIDDRKAAEQRLQEENVSLREEIDKASMFEEIVGTSRPLQAVLSRIAKVAPTDSTVLIVGETGTGKELIARAVHKRSRRAGRPFVSVNCAALPPALVTSELFGHEKGAFTGATHRRLGRFEMADGGTIFLDEVGELLPDTQAALLRVLQEREFERVGGGQPIHADVRVISATNRDLNSAVANGTFRQDLLYRLNVFPIDIPPLRERKGDILILVEYFVQRYALRAGRSIRSIDQKTLNLLQSYDWPGNIRELQNVIERSLILNSSDVFSVDEFWLSKGASPPASRVKTSREWIVEAGSEREIIEAALAESRGRVSGPSGAAAKLRVPPSTLESRIKTLKIDKRRFKLR